MNEHLAKIGVFGGSGLYNLLKDVEEVKVDTPFGAPSAPLMIGSTDGKKVAFLPRHGKSHEYPAHMVNYRANIYAMKSIGVERIIAPCSCGSLQKKIKPGDFVLLDQFVDRTRSRKDSYYKGPVTTHVSMAHPYCEEMRSIVKSSLDELSYPYHGTGTMVVIQGPRFSTKAESRWFSLQGWDVVGMTQYPEVVLAREQEICFTGIALSTDYDVGLEDEPGIEPVTAEEVLKVFRSNIDRVQKLIFSVISKLPDERNCDCGTALSRARFL